MEVLTLCLILGSKPCLLLLVAKFMLSSIYILVLLFLPNKLMHDWDWLSVWFPSLAVINKVPFESSGLNFESVGLLSGLTVTFKF